MSSLYQAAVECELEVLMDRVVPITTSQTESRIRGYIAAGYISLSQHEVDLISKEGKKASKNAAIWGATKQIGQVMITCIGLVLVLTMIPRGLGALETL
jgi:hypothetical protein